MLNLEQTEEEVLNLEQTEAEVVEEEVLNLEQTEAEVVEEEVINLEQTEAEVTLEQVEEEPTADMEWLARKLIMDVISTMFMALQPRLLPQPRLPLL